MIIYAMFLNASQDDEQQYYSASEASSHMKTVVTPCIARMPSSQRNGKKEDEVGAALSEAQERQNQQGWFSKVVALFHSKSVSEKDKQIGEYMNGNRSIEDIDSELRASLPTNRDHLVVTRCGSVATLGEVLCATHYYNSVMDTDVPGGGIGYGLRCLWSGFSDVQWGKDAREIPINRPSVPDCVKLGDTYDYEAKQWVRDGKVLAPPSNEQPSKGKKDDGDSEEQSAKTVAIVQPPAIYGPKAPTMTVTISEPTLVMDNAPNVIHWARTSGWIPYGFRVLDGGHMQKVVVECKKICTGALWLTEEWEVSLKYKGKSVITKTREMHKGDKAPIVNLLKCYNEAADKFNQKPSKYLK